jgi:DNA-binding MarR family transcriptional regulator
MDDNPAFLMADAARLFRRAFNARARELGLTGQQWRVLVVIRRNPGLRQSVAAEMLEVEPITLSRMVDRLADAGMVERRADPSDRRAWSLFLSAAAEPLMDRMRAMAEALTDDALEGFTAAERGLLIDLASRYRANLSRRTESLADE